MMKESKLSYFKIGGSNLQNGENRGTKTAIKMKKLKLRNTEIIFSTQNSRSSQCCNFD